MIPERLAAVFSAILPALAQAQPAPGLQPPPPPIRPIAPPVPVLPLPLWMIVTGAAVALLLTGLLVWLLVRHFCNRPGPPPPTPRELALAALEALRTRVVEVEPYPFSIEVSDVLRVFVSGEFQLRATAQTSPEFLAAAAGSPRFTEADRTLLAAFLERADLIKFARVQAATADSEALLEQALGFVRGGGAA